MISLYKPYISDDLTEMEHILYSGKLSYGAWGRKFETALSQYIGNPKIGVVNSYNSALLIVIECLNLKVGDEVIASPMSCLASNQPFATLGIKLIWADIDIRTGTLDPDSVKKSITPKTKAILHNHFCGYPGYINEINKIGKEFGIFVIDDAIEAFGSEYYGKKVGNVGSDATVYSFQSVRLPNCIDGGAFSFNDEILFEKAKRIRDYGINREKFRDDLGEISEKCDISEPGYGATLNELNSYIGCCQMNSLNKLFTLQRENATLLKDKLMILDKDIIVLNQDFQLPNFWVFGLLVSNKLDYLNFFRSKNLYASSVHLPNNKYSLFNSNILLKGVNDFYSRFLALPSGWWVNKIDYNDLSK